MGIIIPEDLKKDLMRVSELVPYIGNAKKHPEWQVEQIRNSIQAFGFNDPIAIWEDVAGHQVIVEGHGRLLAAKELGMEEVPVIRLNHLDDEGRRAYTLAHNKLTMNTDFDAQILDSELDAIEGLDMAEFGFGAALVSDPYADGEMGSLAERFIIPPFSVLDTRSGDWQQRKRKWVELTGDLSASRDGEYGRFTSGTGGIVDEINGGTSNFDPVLAEILVRWFCPPGGRILDPFGGEQTKGVVAGELGHEYTAIEIRPEQVDIDVAATAKYGGVEYICGDSCRISSLVSGKFDMCLTSPPYYDREVYSAADMSSLGTYQEFMESYRKIFSQCYSLLKDGAFLAIKVGEIRNKKTGEYRNFVADTINCMIDVGFLYYNEIVLVNAVGSARLRATRSMKNRKVCKVHQNVLIFYKGDLGQISELFPVIDFSDVERDESF